MSHKTPSHSEIRITTSVKADPVTFQQKVGGQKYLASNAKTSDNKNLYVTGPELSGWMKGTLFKIDSNNDIASNGVEKKTDRLNYSVGVKIDLDDAKQVEFANIIANNDGTYEIDPKTFYGDYVKFSYNFVMANGKALGHAGLNEAGAKIVCSKLYYYTPEKGLFIFFPVRDDKFGKAAFYVPTKDASGKTELKVADWKVLENCSFKFIPTFRLTRFVSAGRRCSFGLEITNAVITELTKRENTVNIDELCEKGILNDEKVKNIGQQYDLLSLKNSIQNTNTNEKVVEFKTELPEVQQQPPPLKNTSLPVLKPPAFLMALGNKKTTE